MPEAVNIDTILDYLEHCVAQKIPIGPSDWVEAAMKLNVLLSGEHEKLFDLQQKVAQEKGTLLALGNTVAKSKVLVEAMEVNKQANLQKAKIGRIEESIRLAKVLSKMSMEEMRGSL